MLKMKSVISVVLVLLMMLVSFPVYVIADSKNSSIVENTAIENT